MTPRERAEALYRTLRPTIVTDLDALRRVSSAERRTLDAYERAIEAAEAEALEGIDWNAAFAAAEGTQAHPCRPCGACRAKIVRAIRALARPGMVADVCGALDVVTPPAEQQRKREEERTS